MACQPKRKSEANSIIQKDDHSTRRAIGKEHAPHQTQGGQISVSPASTEAEDRNPIWGNDKPRPMKEISALSGMRLGTLRQKVYRREIESVLVGRERQIQPSAMRAYFARKKRPAL